MGSRTPIVTLPGPAVGMREFSYYLAAQFNKTTLFLRRVEFTAVVAAIDATYQAIRTKNQGVSNGLARMVSTCHQSFYSAASCIARGVPLDGAAVSRRAVEVARTALAIKLDPKNADRWISFEKRMHRWRLRQNYEKPPSLAIKYEALNGDPLAEALQQESGMLSDGAVHFTPEYLSRLDFQERKRGTEIHSEYLESDDKEIARDLKMLAAVHLLILQAFDRCAGGGLSRSPEFVEGLRDIAETAKVLFDRYPVPVEPKPQN